MSLLMLKVSRAPFAQPEAATTRGLRGSPLGLALHRSAGQFAPHDKHGLQVVGLAVAPPPGALYIQRSRNCTLQAGGM